MNSIKKSTPKGIIILSCLLGIFLNLSCIAVYLFPSAEGGTDSGGTLGIMYMIVIAAIFIMSIFSHTLAVSSINKFTIVSIIYILIFYYYSIRVYPEPRTPFNHFIVFTIVSMILPSIVKVNIRWVLLSVMFSTIPALLQLNTIFLSTAITYTSDDLLSQGYSYAFMVPSICAIVYIKYYLKRDFGFFRFCNIITIIINLFFATYLIIMGSRGPVVAILALVAIPFVFDVNPQMIGIGIKKKRTFLLVVLFLLMVFYFVPILQIVQDFLSRFNVSFHFIDKFLIREAAGDITSERGEIFDMTMAGFYNRPWFGNGFDQFFNNTGRGYPHNFLTQTLYDGGVFLFSTTILPVFFYLKKWFSNCSYNEYIIILALFFASVPGALFSHDLWEMCNLWFFFGAVLNYKKLVYIKS